MIEEKQRLISVIIPVYNVRDYLERCLNSVLENTYKNLEVICVNDCSPDDSLEILKRFAEKDERVKIVNKTSRGGVSSARNAGLDAASGEYISFVDPDDWIHKQYFESLVYILNRDNADVAVCRYNSVSEMTKDKLISCIDDLKTSMLGIDEIADKNDAVYYAIHYIWNKIYKKEHIGTNRFIENIGLD